MSWIGSRESSMSCVRVRTWRVRARRGSAGRVCGERAAALRRRLLRQCATCAALVLFAFAGLAEADRPSPPAPAAALPSLSQPALVHQIVLAASTGSPYPDVDNTLPVEAAYAVQRAVISELLKQSAVVGFKAGLTDAAGRQRFAAADSISGALFASGRLGHRATVQLDADDQLMIELEVGYVLGRAVTSTLAATDDPFEYVAEVTAVVELPNLNFVVQPGLIDVIASNVSAQQFIVGARRPALSALTLDDLRVRLARDDVQIADGVGRTAQGGQRDALRWLINSRLAQGDTLAAGQLLITGELAGMVPAKPGHYRAVFGVLGNVEFTMKSAAGVGAGDSAPSARLQMHK